METPIFTASVRETPGREYLVVEFRHPLRNDASNRRGRKTRKGLGTRDRDEANRLVDQLNEILRDESLWSIGARPIAEQRFDPRVIEIFYAELELVCRNNRALRDRVLPLPERDSGYVRSLLIGVPGAGKSRLIQQLMGSHPDRDRFPAISVNRTTTFPTEIILSDSGYEAVVTFLTEHETRFEIEESVSAALVRAVEDDKMRVAKELLEQSDLRFRLKYILGDYETGAEESDDPYAAPNEQRHEIDHASEAEQTRRQQVLEGFVERICALAREHRDKIEAARGKLQSLEAEERNAALDSIQYEAECSDEYTVIVSDILEELRSRFALVSVGRFEKSTTGWPLVWRFEANPDARNEFMSAVRFFSDISTTHWGRLLTPLVNGIRAAGPFIPSWMDRRPKLVLFDTEGLGHKADASADVPDHLVANFDEVDSIVLVHSGKNAMGFSTGKALEAIVSAGHTRKTCVVFTHMDVVEGPNLRGRAKFEHAFSNLKNIVEDQLGKSLPAEVVRQVSRYLEGNVFYLGKLQEPEATPAYPELRRLVARLESAAPTQAKAVGFPEFSMDRLVLSIREAAESFRIPWRGRLGLESMAAHSAYPWQSVKAMTRRYAEGFDDGYPLRPASNLLSALSVAISRFLEGPIGWQGTLTDEEKRDVIDRIKAEVSKGLTALSGRRLREMPQPQWQTAYGYRGKGSTYDRKFTVESIYARWVPIPTGSSNAVAQEFLDEVKAIVVAAIEVIRKEAQEKNTKPGHQIGKKKAA
jgi:hypothetical protein